ncbi:MAG: hypothetical protein KY468_04005 [Armatimonadetes bacterium]|nr:hypothetical protein [Armatimonadota bacterium]
MSKTVLLNMRQSERWGCLLTVIFGTMFLKGTALAGLDASFGSNGVVLNTFQGKKSGFTAMERLPDGKILVAGTADGDIGLARFTPDGHLDLSFGEGGTITYDQGRHEYATDLVIQPDGKIIVAGGMLEDSPGSTTYFLALRFTPDGRLDTTFGIEGKVRFTMGSSVNDTRSVALQSDGKIILGGTTGGYNSFRFALARLNQDGSFDSGFGNDGKVLTSIMHSSVLRDLALQPDGKIVAGGITSNANFDEPENFALVRYKENGSLDETFGNQGTVRTSLGERFFAIAENLLLQPDGKIILGGRKLRLFPAPVSDFLMIRYTLTGAMDTAFGDRGIVVTDWGEQISLSAMTVQPDGKIVAAGAGIAYPVGDVLLARYHSDGTLDEMFGEGGRLRTHLGGYEYTSSIHSFSNDRLLAAGSSISNTGHTAFGFLTQFYVGPLIPGDVNRDGGVNMSDAVLVFRYIVELETPTPLQSRAANLHRDDTIDIRDVLAILHEALGIRE